MPVYDKAKCHDETEGAEILRDYRAGEASIHDVCDWSDRSFGDDLLSDEGNAFTQRYFDFERGQYLEDYGRVLQRDLPSQYHVPFTEENYQAIRAVIDARYETWKQTPEVPESPHAPPPRRGLWARVRDLFT